MTIPWRWLVCRVVRHRATMIAGTYYAYCSRCDATVNINA